ncbi:MAG: hypothetical protein ABW101_12195 [Candidatus Thiodiazotropha sp.]
MPRGSHPPRIEYPPVKMVQFTGDAYSAGNEIAKSLYRKLATEGIQMNQAFFSSLKTAYLRKALDNRNS